MLGILFGVLILVLLAAGLTRRKRSARTWVKEERYEETGYWVDKRPGERGTWGSLDAEMTRDRQQLVRQGRVVELAELLRQYMAGHSPSFANLSEEQIRTFRTNTRAQAAQMITNIEQIKNGQPPVAAVSAGDAPYEALKKQILDFAYRHYPALLELDIDTLRSFDLAAGKWAAEVMEDQK
ncbi:MAG: hypothetical protein LH618_14200 [Saprospiraceae bacterium]|nr:hypothetical protein [Saprospiraceae bacterium]